jgi:tRNA(Met) C34 N-acetyltransferase TmcA
MAFADLDFDIGTLVAEAAERQAKRLAERGYFVDAEKSLKEIIEEEKIDKPTRDRIVTFIKSLHQRSHEASQKYERLISQSIIKHQWDRAKELLLQATNQGYSEKLKKYRKIVDTYFQMCKQLEAAKGQLSKDPKSTLRIARDILRSKLAAPLHEMARALEKEAVSKLATSQVKQARLELKQVREHLSKRQYADAAQLIEKAMSYPYASELRSEAKQLKEEFWPLWQRISNNYREDWSTVSIVMGLMLGLAGIVGLLFLPAINFLMALWLGVIVFLAVAGTTEVLYAGSFFIHDGDVHYSSFVI